MEPRAASPPFGDSIPDAIRRPRKRTTRNRGPDYALVAASRSLKNGNGEAEAMREAKTYASFSGPMRANLVAMLDSIGVNQWLSSPLLRRQLLTWFASELVLLPNAVFVPLGPVVDEALQAAAQQVGFDCRRVVSGLPHPSGANPERIAFFLGRKRREDLSSKVDSEKLIAARQRLDQKISALSGIEA